MRLKSLIQFSLFTILSLFALNFALNFWNEHQKSQAVEQLQLQTQLLAITTSIKQGIVDIQKQVTRLGQLPQDSVPALSAAEKDRVEAQAARVAGEITQLKSLADEVLMPKVSAMQARYMELSASWHLFYNHFGTDSAQAMTEFVLHAEPFSQQLIYQDLPALEAFESEQIGQAQRHLQAVEWWSERTALTVFAVSLLIALAFAVRIYRRVVDGTRAFASGVAAVREGGEARIGLQTRDELGEIAAAFNTVSNDLHDSRKQCGVLEHDLAERNAEVEAQRKESQSLLRNILPATVAEEFRNKGTVQPKYLEDVTILFTDFVGFSASTEKLAAEDLVHMLHDYFSAFDEICARYGMEKLKTIGDSYMCAAGLPERNPSHPVDAVMAAMEIVQAVTERANRNPNWSIRIGIHTGHVIAGMVGMQKFAYDIWGESVNYASRVESSGEPNRIALSAQTHGRIKDFFECEKRVKTHSKVSHKMELYFVNGFTPSLVEDTKQMPPEAFVRRYRGYFEKEPPSFPPLRTALSGKAEK
ncbi:MAG: adenylate/guanylate cyclase domain-containing protein [Sideroxydans sp.]|nr:adenylate/guanylate cyclase domain-containing protein [Sideroxydans sp.]